MNDINIETENIVTRPYETVGQQLHRAETAIGVGRRALYELVRQELVDEEAVAEQRQAIALARQQRNNLRQQLRDQKVASSSLPNYGWQWR